MTNLFKSNFEWQKRYYVDVVNHLKSLTPYMVEFSIASDYQDMKQSTDFILTMNNRANIAVRLRKFPCNFRDLTLRSQSYHNAKTEVDKLREGFADWYFYGWVDAQNSISEYMLLDIDLIRQSGLLNGRSTKLNKDNRTGFVSISISELHQANAIVAAKIYRLNKWHVYPA